MTYFFLFQQLLKSFNSGTVSCCRRTPRRFPSALFLMVCSSLSSSTFISGTYKGFWQLWVVQNHYQFEGDLIRFLGQKFPWRKLTTSMLRASLVAWLSKNLPPVGDLGSILGLEKAPRRRGMATRSILAWELYGQREPGRPSHEHKVDDLSDRHSKRPRMVSRDTMCIRHFSGVYCEIIILALYKFKVL